MAKKKKSSLDKVLNLAGDLVGVANKLPDLSLLQGYDVVKNVANDSANTISINSKQEKIKKLLIEIGNRICEKNITVNDKNVMAEVQCIKELQEQLNLLKNTP